MSHSIIYCARVACLKSRLQAGFVLADAKIMWDIDWVAEDVDNVGKSKTFATGATHIAQPA